MTTKEQALAALERLECAIYTGCMAEDWTPEGDVETVRAAIQSKPVVEPKIITSHFHGKEMPLTSVLYALAGQESNDGDEGSVMQAAADFISALEAMAGGQDD